MHAYPWSHLFTDDTSLPVDTHDQQELLQRQEVTIKSQQDKLTDMQSISTKTFDLLSTKLKELTHDNKTLREEKDALALEYGLLQKNNQELTKIVSLLEKEAESRIATLQVKYEELRKHGFDELVYQIVIHHIMNHKAGLKGEEGRKKTFKNVIRWLQQRRNVVNYLRHHQILTDTADELENILFVDEKNLTELMNRLEI